jgi:hypothetical protein
MFVQSFKMLARQENFDERRTLNYDFNRAAILRALNVLRAAFAAWRARKSGLEE